MTREEKIIETAKLIYSPSSGVPQSLSMRVGFIEGAKWADEHPNPNTTKKIFKFALEKTNFLIADSLESIDWGILIKKAMEE